MGRADGGIYLIDSFGGEDLIAEGPRGPPLARVIPLKPRPVTPVVPK